MKDVTVIEGVTSVIDGKGYGIEYEDGYSTSYGFVNLNKAKISDPKFCKKPQDMGYGRDSRLGDAKLVKVRRTIITEIIE